VVSGPWSAEIVSVERGSTQRLALPGPESPRGWHLSWSPNGRFFAYTTAWDEWDRRPQVWVVRLADGQGVPVTEVETRDDTFNSSPSWSPDSRSLYFISNRGGSMDLWRRGIATEGTPTGTSQRLTTGVEMLFARFSPDAKRLAYSKGRKMANIWRVPFSPGGNRLYFGARRGGRGNLYEKELGSSTDRQLTDFAGRPGYLAWVNDTDGEFLYFTWNEDHGDLWVMDVEDGR
jgi:Tol biopolymer transport system component